MRYFNLDRLIKRGFSNLFVRCTPIYDQDEMIELIDHHRIVKENHPFASPIEFISSAIQHELDNQYKYKTGRYKQRLFMKFEFLLPKESISNKQLRGLTNRLISTCIESEDLPYLSFLCKRGTANYLTLIVYERHYIENGFLDERIATCNRYRNAITGKCCKSTDEHAVLFMEKGTVYSSKISYYSNKTTRFAFVGQSSFSQFIYNLREKLIEFCIGNFNIKNGYSFKRVNEEIFLKRPIQCNIIHTFMKTFERSITNMIDILNQLNLFENPFVYDEIYRFCSKYDAIFNQGQFKVKRVVIPISASLPYYFLKENCERLHQLFYVELQQLQKFIFENY